MTNYRLYFHNRAGHFARAEDLAAETDAEAIESAFRFGHPHGVEVWERARRVGFAGPEGAPVASEPDRVGEGGAASPAKDRGSA